VLVFTGLRDPYSLSVSHTHFNYAVFFFLLVWGNYKSLITDIDPQNVYLGPSYIIIKAKYNIFIMLEDRKVFSMSQDGL